MTNHDKWRKYLASIVSPDSYIDMGFWWMISAALGRKVWVGDANMHPTFPNLYIIFVGPAGLGKGLVLKPVIDLLKYHKKPDAPPSDDTKMKALAPRWYVIPTAPDASTYEALVAIHGNTQSVLKSPKPYPPITLSNGAYIHCSLAACLEEMSSLFRKDSEAVVNYLLTAFDCGTYQKSTKTQGDDFVYNSCLNFLAGTTPAFMEKAFSQNLLDEGFSSRTIFVSETSRRFEKFGIDPLSPEQMECKKDLQDWLKKIASLFGPVYFAPDAYVHCKVFFEQVQPGNRISKDIRLDAYYARKPALAVKLAMAMHFAESTEMVLTKQDCEKSLATLARLEVKMADALRVTAKNPTSQLNTHIVNIITKHYPGLFMEKLVEILEVDYKREDVLRTAKELIKSNRIRAIVEGNKTFVTVKI